ncbi:MAG: hypothetical protein AMJ68_09420 [Acidithiobacillales bacterium SG8_45]|nr:MAG: hypothetical protein AMJ68_09420 [Acidithiobacillales bacterium SG8_45]
METSTYTWVIATIGLVLITILMLLQFVAILKPRSEWTIKNVYGGNPDSTDSKAYFAFNQGFAYADAIFWGPLQIAGSAGMLMGERWGYLLALIASVPFWYTAIPIFIWDRDMGFRKNSFTYWVFIWGMFPLFGFVEMVYCFLRLL